MKRWLTVLMTLCCLIGMIVFSVSAESAATRVDYYATVNIDGDCLVTMTVNLHLDAAMPSLTFPIPAKASNVTVNGSSVSTSVVGSTMQVSLDRAIGNAPGDYPVQLAFSVPKTVTVVEPSSVIEERKLKLDVPILCGFSYPVQSLNYTITLPSDIEDSCEFYSTYRQNGIASDLQNNISRNMVTGSSKTVFNDHESMSMSMTMSMATGQAMFPGVNVYLRTGNPELVPMGVLAGLAFLYWLLFLRTLPPRRERSTQPPEGISAGELGCRLTLSGGDLTMMVFAWAQMGYLLIHLDGNNRVLLHKRMDMGNERSLFEVRLFKLLFGQRRVIDCSGNHYAKLCRKAARMVPGEKTLCKAHSGNVRLFRWLLCGSQLFCGICVAMNMTSILALQILFSFLFGAFGLVSAWLIQEMAYGVFLRGRLRLWMGMGCIALWAIFGLICSQVWIPLGACAVQLIAGFFAAYGGRRTDLNRYDMTKILGLRRYLKKISVEETSRLQKIDPDFFFRMAPYAMAMGVLKPFAATFGKRKLEQSAYLMTKVHGRRKADEWALLMVQAADLMDARYRQMETEKWLPIRLR